jgi:phospho-N-acetylmuramoyl-pentapeptide-transferase
MVDVLIAGIVAMVISIVAGPRFITFLRLREYGQPIRAEGPARHVEKQGTPTMGGLLILFSAAVPYLILSNYSTPALTVCFCTVGCGAIGFIDDYIKVTHQRSLGLSGRWKLLLLLLITGVVAYVAYHRNFSTDLYLPGFKIPLSWAWYPFLFVIIAGAANGVNLTDGIDGLAAGTGIIAIFTFTAMTVIAFIRSGAPGHREIRLLDLSIVGAALIGALVGFLWYNAFPAEIFMGDTGSMAIGGALAGFAIMTKTEVLLLFVGGIFLVAALSVMIQVFSFKYFHRRVFLMAPIQHHFEMKAWSETKIMVRFWILTAILCACGFALYYRYYFRFFRGG